MADKKIFAIVGPTACGKTAVSVEVARATGGEVVCCDSMQIYRGMPIGTAAPSEDERLGVPHHLFEFLDPAVSFSCSDYVALADRAVADITSRGASPILVGGTGLYLDSLVLGCGDASAAPNPELRAELQLFYEQNGVDALYSLLVERDPDAASAIHKNNVKRVIRALEICHACGSKTEYDRRARQSLRYDATVVGLRFADRARLYSRIERRVDAMLDAGLLDETRRLLDEGVFETNATAAQAIGYKELIPYLRGEDSLESCVETLKSATRRYAKRQMTWFSARPYVNWVDCDGIEDEKIFENIVKNVLKVFNN